MNIDVDLAHSCAIFLFYLGGEIYHLVGQLTRSVVEKPADLGISGQCSTA